jgi:hypothetical protein
MDGNNFDTAKQNNVNQPYLMRTHSDNPHESAHTPLPHRINKKNKFILIAIILFAFIILVIGTAVFIIYNHQKSDLVDSSPVAEDELINLANEVSQFDAKIEGSLPYEDLKNKLENFISSNKEEEIHSRATALLAQLYLANGDPRFAIDTIEGHLEKEDISDATRARLLISLAHIYEQVEEPNGLIRTLKKIAALPNDIKLPQENWLTVKNSFKTQLQQLTSETEDEN